MPLTRPKKSKAKDENPTTSTGPFQRFQDLTRKLINVPKNEIDQAEKNYNRPQKRRKAKHSF